MTHTVFENARLFTGVDGEVVDGAAIWVDGRHVREAGHASTVDAPADAVRVDVGGRFVMPGMTESHIHLSYANASLAELNMRPLPVATMDAVRNARLVLGSGFTSAISFGSAQGVDVHLRDLIAAGRVPGPRLAASDRDLGSTGSNADPPIPGSEGIKLIADGPWAVRQAVRHLARSRCDVVKIFLDGEALNEVAPPGLLTYTDEEVNAAVSEAHTRGMRVACHARSAAAVKQAVRAGIEYIGHANYLDDEAVDLLASQRHRIFVGPAIAWEVQLLERGHEVGLPRAAMERRGYQREIDETISAVKRLRDVGVRILPGGDYGLDITPHGTNARDLEYFVDLFAMSPTEALLCATRDGGAAADADGMVGTIEPDTYADLVFVDGDPTEDITVLTATGAITAVMKNGVLYRGLLDDDPYRAAAESLDDAHDTGATQ